MSNRVVSEERVEPPAAVWCHSKVTARAERSSLSPRRGMRLQSIVRGINRTRAQIQCPSSRLCSASWQCLDSAPRLEEGRRHILLNSLRTRQASRGRGGGSALRASALALRASKSAALQPGAQACGEWRRLFAARLEVGKRRSSLDHKRAESGGACSRESGGASQCVAAARRVWRRRQGVAAARISSLACQASSLVVAAELLLDGSAQRPVEAAASLEAVEAGD